MLGVKMSYFIIARGKGTNRVLWKEKVAANEDYTQCKEGSNVYASQCPHTNTERGPLETKIRNKVD